MRFGVWLAGLGVLAGGAGCSASTQPTDLPLEGMTGAWVGVAPVFIPTDSLELFVTDSAGNVTVFGRFNSGAYQEYSFGFLPSSTAGITTRLTTFTPPFVATLDVHLDGSSLVGTYNDAPIALTRLHPAAVPTGLWVRTAVTGPNDSTISRVDSIWLLRDGRVHRRLQAQHAPDITCINNGQGVPVDRPNAVVLIYLWNISQNGCNLPARDSLIIQGSTLRRRTDTIFGVTEEVYQHPAP